MVTTQVVATVAILSGPLLAYPGPLLFVAGQPVPRVVTSVAVALLVVALAIARRTRLGGGYRPDTPVNLGKALLGVALLVGTFFTWWGSNNDYIEVGPPSAAGCRAWVEESSFLFIGTGSSYSAGPWQLVALPSGSWVVDDGYRPVREGQYTVSWSQDGRSVAVGVFGTSADPVVSESDGPGPFCW
jgi:hypothetical protein